MTKALYSIMVAMNQPLVEAGIAALLSEDPSFRIIKTVREPDNVLAEIIEKKPDLVIIDYNLPGFVSLDDLQSFIQNIEHLNVLVISSDEHTSSILRSVQSGIKGYITKDCGKNEFILAVESTAKGEKFFCSKILDIIIANHLPEEKADEYTILTVREQEILKLLAEGHSTQKIADALHLSPHTVQTHRKSIIRKLKIKSPTQFVIFALDMGLITQK